MGKTSLVRELLRQLKEEGSFETIFVDLEAADTPADAIAEIGVQSRSAKGVVARIGSWFANVQQQLGERIEATSDPNIWMSLLGTMINAGNWRHKGDQIFAALADNDRRVVLVIDELPILVNRLLTGNGERITPERTKTAADFLSWLRKNGQTHLEGSALFSLVAWDSGRYCNEPASALRQTSILRSISNLGTKKPPSPASLRWRRVTASSSPSPSARTCAAGCGVRFPTTCSYFRQPSRTSARCRPA